MEKPISSKLPGWVVKHKKSGTEVKAIKGYYYLYAISSKWDSEKKRAIKKTSVFLEK